MIKVTNEEFLKAIFGEMYHYAHVCSFPDDPSNITTARRFYCWGGGWYKDTPIQDNSNQYFTVSLFSSDDSGKARRRKALFSACYIVMLDDVYEKLPIEQVNRLPEPSYKLQTSLGSLQYGYILDVPCTDRSRLDNLQDGLIAKGLAPNSKDPGQKGCTRYVRLPNGVNTKASKLVDGRPSQCQLLEFHPERKVSIEALAEPFGVQLDAERREGRTDGAAAVDDHPLLDLEDIIHIKSVRSDGRFDITCPWVDEHTNAADDGAAIFTNADGSIGFRCHHGNCEQRTGRDLLDLIEESHTGFRKKLEQFKMARQFNQFLAMDDTGVSKTPISFLDSAGISFLNPEPAAAAPVLQSPADEGISFQTIIDKLKRLPCISEQAIQMACALLKAVDNLDHATRLGWHNEIRDHMKWTKSDLQKIIEEQRLFWYPRTNSDNFFADFIYVSISNQFYNHRKRIWYELDAFQNTFAHINEEARRDALVEGLVEKVDQYDYAPGMPLIFEEKGLKYVNGWTEMVDQSVAGDASRWLNHFDVLGWGANKKHLLQWMAYTLRHPERKINHMIILGGGEGNGKDFILYPMCQAFGRDSVTVDGDQLLAPYNGFMMGKKYIQINETELGDRLESKQVTNKLKPIACAPPDLVMINEKYLRGVSVRNICCGAMTSNSAVPLQLSGDSRRYYPVWTDLSIRGEDGQVTLEWEAYFDDLWTWIRDCEGWKVCINYLMHQVDLSDFNPGKAPLVTEFMREIQEASADPVALIISELKDLNLGRFEADLVTAGDVFDMLKSSGTYGVNHNLKNIPSVATIGKIMKQERIGISVRAWHGKNHMRVWIIRNREKYETMKGGILGATYVDQQNRLKIGTPLTVVK